MQVSTVRNCISEHNSLNFPRLFQPWRNSVIWTRTLRDLPRAGRSLWNQNVLRRRSSRRSGRARQPFSASAWWGSCGQTGWPMPCGREGAKGRLRQAQSQDVLGQISRADHKSHVCTVIEVFVPTSKIPLGLRLPGLFLMSRWTVSKEVLMNISTEKDVGHIYGGRRWVQRQIGRPSLAEYPSHQKEGERWVWLLVCW